jgi:hypothetical protein
MADLLEDFQTYFIEAGLVTAENSFLDQMPDNNLPVATAIYEYQGSQGSAHIAGAHRSVQIVVRSANVKAARAKIKELYNSLITEEHTINLTPMRWGMLYLRQPPFRFKIDEQKRVHYVFNLGITTYTD